MPNQCSNGNVHPPSLYELNGDYYYSLDSTQTHNDAQAACQAKGKGVALPVFKTKEQFDAITIHNGKKKT